MYDLTACHHGDNDDVTHLGTILERLRHVFDLGLMGLLLRGQTSLLLWLQQATWAAYRGLKVGGNTSP